MNTQTIYLASKPHYEILDGLRGVAAVMVVAFHLLEARHYKIFCVNGKYGIQVEFRIFYFIALQNEEDYERKESSSA